MDLLSFMKQKTNNSYIANNNQSEKKQDKDNKKPTKHQRMDTEAGQLLNKKHNHLNEHNEPSFIKKPQKIQKSAAYINRHETSVASMKQKTSIKLKVVLENLWQLKMYIENEYQSLLNNTINRQNYREIIRILNSNFFRFRYGMNKFDQMMNEYSRVLSGLQLLISKLKNNQLLPQMIMVRDQEDFVLFFKLFFSKPYTLINMNCTRKIIKLLWDKLLFDSLTLPAMINNLRLWIFGISTPLNPSMNQLHQYVIDKSQQISRFVNHKSNHYVYIGVNESDAIGLTPLMVATITKSTKAVQKLIKNGANIFVTPLTYCTKDLNQSIDESKYGKKILYKKQIGLKDRKQPNIIEILRQQNRIDQIGQILCWKSFYQKRKLKKDTDLSDIIFSFPNCSFQIDWKQYKGILCFKELPQDIITIYKKDYSLRIDFHVKDLQTYNKKQKEHFSLILKSYPKTQSKLYLIHHTKKQIINVLEDKNLGAIKQQFNTILKYGNIYNSEVNQFKAMYIPQENRLTANISSYFQNVVRFNSYRFTTLREYLKIIMNSEIVNYKQIEKNQFSGVINQKIAVAEKVKSKIVQENSTIDIQWSDQALNLNHLQFVLDISNLAFPSSLTLNKIKNIVQIIKDPIFKQKKFSHKLPLRCKYTFNNEINLQSEIKNIKYGPLDESIFNIQIRAFEQQYQQVDEKVDLSHLQDTVFIDQNYSINASRFMGKSEQCFQIQEQQVNKKFDMLLKLQGVWSDDQEEK